MKNHWVREHFVAGQIIFREGDVGEDAYLIEHGKISISAHRGGQEKVLATMETGEMFGEIALIDKLTRTASATATEDTTLIPISRDLVVSKLKHADPLLSHILQIIVDHYRESLGAPKRVGESAEEDGLHKLREYAIAQLKVAQSMSDAIARHEFEVFFQPVVYLDDGRLGGFEALVRWNQPGVGVVSPSDFIGVAEETGLIVPIGRWILKTALAALAEFQACMDRFNPGSDRLFMSVNVSVRQLKEFGEIDELARLISESGNAPGRIKLEVTESALIDNPETAVLSLRQLKALGVLLAIDDFGTGYSSLSYLSQFPLDTLKIDQSFVATMRESESSRRITRAIAGMATDLGMNCIAEGIEHIADIEALRDMGCEFGQGFYFSRPRRHADVLDYIETLGAGKP